MIKRLNLNCIISFHFKYKSLCIFITFKKNKDNIVEACLFNCPSLSGHIILSFIYYTYIYSTSFCSYLPSYAYDKIKQEKKTEKRKGKKTGAILFSFFFYFSANLMMKIVLLNKKETKANKMRVKWL